MIAVDWRNMSWVTNSFQVGWVIVVPRIDLVAVAIARHMASLEIMSPWENISELQQRVPEQTDVSLLDCQKDAVGDEAAWGTSFHCMDLPHPA